MDYYYRRLFGNGAVASKFRLDVSSSVKLRSLDIREGGNPSHTDSTTKGVDGVTSEGSQTGFENSVGNRNSPETSRNMSAAIPALTARIQQNLTQTIRPIESADTHHSNNCNRCYRLKKKCLREYPKCSNCLKSGSDCEYVDRTTKRRRRTSPTMANDDGKDAFIHMEGGEPSSLAVSTEVHQGSGDSFGATILNSTGSGSSGSSGSSSTRSGLASQSSTGMSISSLLSDDKGRSFVERISHKASRAPASGSSSTEQEYLNVRPIEDPEIPTRAALAFFHNYGSRCPFIQETEFLDALRAIDFTLETIVSTEMYLVLSVGALIHDKTSNTGWFGVFFSEKRIMEIIDVLDFLLVESLKLLLLLVLFCVHLYKEDMLWELLGVLVRQAIKGGLYREVEENKRANYIEKEVSPDKNDFSKGDEGLNEDKGGQHVLEISLNDVRIENKDTRNIEINLQQDDLLYSKHDKTIHIEADLRRRIFWSIYNLDKLLSLVVDVPSQLPLNDFITIRLPQKMAPLISPLVELEITFSKLVDRLLSLKLSSRFVGENGKSAKSDELKSLSLDIEKWRVGVTKAIHSSTYLEPESYVTLVNINYYYFLIEIDQISLSESFQFTLQYLLNLFTLIITDNEDRNDKKRGLQFGLGTVFWYLQLFKVVHYLLASLSDVVKVKDDLNRMETSLKLSEFNSNLQLMVNLFKYLSKQSRHEEEFGKKLGFYSGQLGQLAQKMMQYLMVGGDRSGIVEEVEKIRRRLSEME